MSRERLAQLAIPVVLIAIWESLPPVTGLDLFVSTPSAITRRLVEFTETGVLWGHAVGTIRTTTVGLAAGSFLGIGIGILLGMSPRLYQVVGPFVAAGYSFPRIVLFPLFVLWFGAGETSKLLLVAIVVLFIMLVNTLTGLRALDRDRMATVRLLGATKSQLVVLVILPSVLPFILSGIGMTVPWAFLAAVVGEMLGGDSGVGYLIERSAGQFDSAGMMASVMVVAFLGTLATLGIARPAEKYLQRMRQR